MLPRLLRSETLPYNDLLRGRLIVIGSKKTGQVKTTAVNFGCSETIAIIADSLGGVSCLWALISAPISN